MKGNIESSYRTGNVNIIAANIGFRNVGKFKAVSTVASQGLTDTEKSNARANIGARTRSFSGAAADNVVKELTVPNFKLVVGARVTIKFTIHSGEHRRH